MKRKIYRYLCLISMVVLGITALASLFFFYRILLEQVRHDLRSEARFLCRLDLSGAARFPVEEGVSRITVVDPAGTVLLDTQAESGAMDNHGDRPEVRAALASGEGWALRRSGTLGRLMVYYALRRDDGRVLRLSRRIDTLGIILLRALPLFGLLYGGLFIGCRVVASTMTRRIILPMGKLADQLDSADLTPPYPELAPFISALAEKNRDLQDQMALLHQQKTEMEQLTADMEKSGNIRREFTANVSHELKTPLTTIRGYAELIANGMAGEGMEREFAGKIERESLRLLSLITDILKLSELENFLLPPEEENCGLREIAAECIESLTPLAKEKNLCFELVGEDAVVRGDRGLLEQLVRNLCDNAVRYNREGGSVRVKVSSEGGVPSVTVGDTGIGIPPEHQSRIFERFYRVDKSRSKASGGTGLGLAIVKHIAEKYQAEITVSSAVGEGTAITVRFPSCRIIELVAK
ncbi:MAG: two-component sensor histidine kinase [Spirochaetaceae bacterium]|jgi:two-component system phosphate regulon sensor histidine kinase PhoR|nr:two-component sensor histidine kinase [Spirochaetaceae bacterium]